MTERVIMPGDEGAGEEDDRHDENSAGDDHHPGRSLVEARRLQLRAEAEAGRGVAAGTGARVLGSSLDNADARAGHQTPRLGVAEELSD